VSQENSSMPTHACHLEANWYNRWTMHWNPTENIMQPQSGNHSDAFQNERRIKRETHEGLDAG
jgi:hypothetical protein